MHILEDKEMTIHDTNMQTAHLNNEFSSSHVSGIKAGANYDMINGIRRSTVFNPGIID